MQMILSSETLLFPLSIETCIEVGLDITKHRNKVIAGKSCDIIFAVVGEGDGKMTQNATLGITT